MKDKQISLMGLAVMSGLIGLLFVLAQSGALQFGKPQAPIVTLSALPPTFKLAPSSGPEQVETEMVARAIDAMPATAAGQPSSLSAAPVEKQPPEVYLGGKLATGRVSEVYLKVADNVFLSLDRAPEHLRNTAERWVDVEFPELLAGDTGSARAFLNRSDAKVAVGDVVEIKFAHKDNPRYFPVKELTRVTDLVASKDQLLARDYERRILIRTAALGNTQPQWLTKAVPAQTEATGNQSLQTAVAKR